MTTGFSIIHTKTHFEESVKSAYFVNKIPALQLSIIIVNFNVKYFLEQCLYSVIKACKGIDAGIFVVDNCSTDGSREWLEPKFPGVNFVWNTTNTGFGKASNSVLAQAKAEHILFLNPDTIIAEDCLQKCLHFFAATPGCGALGVRMVDGSGEFLKESKRSFPSAKYSFFKLSGLARLFPGSNTFAGYYAGNLADNKNHKVEVLAGAFMMLSKKAIEATGGFDEDFFMYAEDIDLSYRVRQAGLENWYFADTTIVHFKGESTHRLTVDYIDQFYGAMQLFVSKHYHGKEKSLFFLNLSIHIVKALARLKIKLWSRQAEEMIRTGPARTAVVAGQVLFDRTLQLIKFAQFPLLLCGRISIKPNERDFCIGHRSQLPELIKKHTLEQVIFCEGEISFLQIIDQVKDVKIKTNFLFTAAGSRSIVGSSNKNARGIFIAEGGAPLSKAASVE